MLLHLPAITWHVTIAIRHFDGALVLHCARKYGPDWNAYTARMRWRILPFVY